MSQRETAIRHLKIISFLRQRKKAPFDEIQAYLNRCGQDTGDDLYMEKRTFFRDIHEIESIYGIEIVCDRKNESHYSIKEDNPIDKYAIESFETFSALNSGKDLTGSILFETRTPKGIENLSPLIYAIRNKFETVFSYKKFYEIEPQIRTVYPLGLKESANFWYLIAFCTLRKDIRTFALDRISEIDVTNERFNYESPNLMQDMFHDCFGVVRRENGSIAEEIILSFSPFRGNYIKNFPLHASQIILIDNEKELRIRLHLHITRDFVSELLKYVGELRIVSPESLIQRYFEKLAAGMRPDNNLFFHIDSRNTPSTILRKDVLK
jgi:predicted DNA-binding transcriptional regulator YafY